MKYVLVSPYPLARRNGVVSYLEQVRAYLVGRGVETVLIGNDDNLPRPDYRARVRDVITTRFRPDEVLIEGSEVSCPTLFVPPEYRAHIRLHCPSAFVERLNQRPVDAEQFANEIRVVRQASVVSAPSYALLGELRPYVDVDSVHVYKNPPPPVPGVMVPARDRRHDVVFMGNFSRLKGVDFINPMLARLPSHYSVVLLGRESERFQVADAVRCRVSVRPFLPGPERLTLIREARVILSLSRFENCSMLVLESLSAGTVVCAWDVGGHAEIAGPRLLRLVPLGNVGELASAVVATIDGAYPAPEEFRAAFERVTDDFRSGWSHVWRRVRNGGDGAIYRGLHSRRVTPPLAAPSPDSALTGELRPS